MKKILLLAILLLINKYSYATDWTADANAVANWRMSEGSGTTIDDSTSNNYVMTFAASTADPSWSVMSGTDAPTDMLYQVVFDGDDYTSSAQISMAGWTGLSAGGWVIYDSSGTDEHCIVSNLQANNASILLRLEPTDDTIEGFIYLEANTQTGGTFNDTTITANQWFHIVMTYDKTSIKAYVNGVLDTGAFSATANLDANNSTANPYLGGSAHAVTDTLTGSLGEQFIFNDSLDSTEVNSIMIGGLLGDWGTSTRNRIIIIQ